VLVGTTPRSGGTGLHAEQHFTYHQALRPGDILQSQRSEGKTWTKTGRRGGKLLFADEVVSYTNQRSELVVAVRSVRVRTERTVSA
jgi:hypothetical protein